MRNVLGGGYYKLGDICKVISGGTPSKKVSEYWIEGNIPWLSSTVCKNMKKISSITSYISDKALTRSSVKIVSKDTTLIALVGATIGKIAFTDKDYAINQNIAALYPNDPTFLNTDYLFYACSMLYNKFLSLAQGKLAMANLSFVRNLKIFVPCYEKQKKIAELLDLFSSYTESISIGLPAEINAREKQYEYYRDKLLTFKEKKSA